MKVSIIGSGVSGMCCNKAKVKGFAVDVYENKTPGGKLCLKLDKFRFDAGPSLFTMPHLVDELFELHLNPRDYFTYQKKPV